MQSADDRFRDMRNNYLPRVRFHTDDYLQYAPAALMLGLKAAGLPGRSSWGRMLVSDAFSTGIMAITINSLKYTCLLYTSEQCPGLELAYLVNVLRSRGRLCDLFRRQIFLEVLPCHAS